MDDIRADFLNINPDEEENNNVVDARYEPLYQALQNEVQIEEIQAVLQEAPGQAKCGEELFEVLEFAITETKAVSAVLNLLLDQDPTCVLMEALYEYDDSGETLLHMVLKAAEQDVNRMEFIERILTLHPQTAKMEDNDGYLPLHIASYMEEVPVDAISLLLDCYPQAAGIAVPSLGECPLHMAATRWNMPLDIMKRIVDLCPEAVFKQDDSGKLPFHYSCRLARLEIIKYLSTLHPKGAAVQDVDGRTPLHIAHEHHTQPLEVMKLLIELNPAGIHTADGLGWLPLHHTCNYKESLGSNLLRDNYYERTFRDTISKEERDKRYNDDYEKLIHLLIELHPAGVCVRDNAGLLPLHHACCAPTSVRILKTLLNNNPSHISATNNYGVLPLHWACGIPASIENIRYLLGQDPYSVLKTTQLGLSPLEMACEYREAQEDAFDQEEQDDVQEVIRLLTEKENEAFQEVKNAVLSTCDDLGFPDLVAARVWQFAKPKLWRRG